MQTQHRYTHRPTGLVFEFAAEPSRELLDALVAQALEARDAPPPGISEQAARILDASQPCSCDPAEIWAAAFGGEARCHSTT